jgi:Lipase 3 N-terminal region
MPHQLAWKREVSTNQRISAELLLIQLADVSAGVLSQLNLWEQYAAAAYCVSNNNSPGNKVSCAAGNCPLVEAATTTTTIEFQK